MASGSFAAVLLLTVVLHIWAAVVLTLENRSARPSRYDANNTIQASYASRTMRWSGFIVLAFLLFHLAHFTARVTHPEYNDLMAPLADGTMVRDVYSMMVIGFADPFITGFYILSIGLLSMHLEPRIEQSLPVTRPENRGLGRFPGQAGARFRLGLLPGQRRHPSLLHVRPQGQGPLIRQRNRQEYR